MPTLNFLSLDIDAMYNDITKHSILIRTEGGTRKLGYPKIPKEIKNNLNKKSVIAIFTEGYSPIASITRQLHPFNLKPLNYYVNDQAQVFEHNKPDINGIFKTDYLLYFGK